MIKKTIKVLFIIILFFIILVFGIVYIQKDTNSEKLLSKAVKNNQENIESQEKEMLERKFEDEVTVPLSNSKIPSGYSVYNTFNVTLDDESNIIEKWKTDENTGLKYIKITSYSEYKNIKESLNGLREMTKEDFVNYFMIIVINENIEYVPKFEKLKHEEDRETISLNFCKEKQENTDVVYNGSWIVMPNSYDRYKLNMIYLGI